MQTPPRIHVDQCPPFDSYILQLVHFIQVYIKQHLFLLKIYFQFLTLLAAGGNDFTCGSGVQFTFVFTKLCLGLT